MRGVGDDVGFGTGESGNTMQQLEDTAAGASEPQQQQRSELLPMTVHVSPWSSYAY